MYGCLKMIKEEDRGGERKEDRDRERRRREEGERKNVSEEEIKEHVPWTRQTEMRPQLMRMMRLCPLK